MNGKESILPKHLSIPHTEQFLGVLLLVSRNKWRYFNPFNFKIAIKCWGIDVTNLTTLTVYDFTVNWR